MLRRATFAFLVCAVSTLSVPAALADDAGVCKDENAAAEAAVEACTRIIKAGKTKGNDLRVSITTVRSPTARGTTTKAR